MNKFYALYHKKSGAFCFRKNWIDKLDFSLDQPPVLWKNVGLAKGSLTRIFNKRRYLYSLSDPGKSEWEEFFLELEIVEVSISLGKTEYSNLFSVGKVRERVS